MRKMRKLLRNERGQGMLEYVLLLAVVAGLVMVFKGKITSIFTQATTSLDSSTQQVFSGGNGGG
jgi:Flp pilus assembly pilin Flp